MSLISIRVAMTGPPAGAPILSTPRRPLQAEVPAGIDPPHVPEFLRLDQFCELCWSGGPCTQGFRPALNYFALVCDGTGTCPFGRRPNRTRPSEAHVRPPHQPVRTNP